MRVRTRLKKCSKRSGCWPAGVCMQVEIEKLFDERPEAYTAEHFHLFENFKPALNAGEIPAAEPDASSKTVCRVNEGEKKGILIVFRMGRGVALATSTDLDACMATSLH